MRTSAGIRPKGFAAHRARRGVVSSPGGREMSGVRNCAPGVALIGLLLMSLLLSSCTVRMAPPPELPPEATEPDRWAASSWDELPGPVPAGWVAAFGDPQLEAIVAEALAQNQNLQSAAAQLEAARLSAVKAGANLYPSIGLSAGGDRVGGFDDEPHLQPQQ